MRCPSTCDLDRQTDSAMKRPDFELIAAMASAPGSSGRGIIRISGVGAAQSIENLFEADDPEWSRTTSARRCSGKFLLTRESDQVEFPIPVAVYFWPTRQSYTGEPLVEIHAPGSPVLLERMLSQIFSQGVRPAQRGEFTLRAFLAGKIDLVQAEGVLGTIDARDSEELQRALSQLAGGISRGFVEMRHDLLNLLADLEAGLDFTDEGLTFVSQEVVLQRMDAATDYLRKLLTQASQRFWNRDLPRVVIIGPTNAGKSTLFNALIGDMAAIVSAQPGTTRDLVSRDVCWEGVSLKLIDSAGEETAPSEQVADGLKLRDTELQGAEVILRCEPISEANLEKKVGSQGLENPPNQLRVLTKTDLIPPSHPSLLTPPKPLEFLTVSAHSGNGISQLRSAILEKLRKTESTETLIGTTAARCRQSLEQGIEGLVQARELALQQAGDELVTQELRLALEGLGEVTGEVYTEDLLDRIFSRFCIGK